MSLDALMKKELVWFDLSVFYLIPLKTYHFSNLVKCGSY